MRMESFIMKLWSALRSGREFFKRHIQNMSKLMAGWSEKRYRQNSEHNQFKREHAWNLADKD